VRPGSSSSSAASRTRINARSRRGGGSSESLLQRSRVRLDTPTLRAMSRASPAIVTTSAAASTRVRARVDRARGSTPATSVFSGRPAASRNRRELAPALHVAEGVRVRFDAPEHLPDPRKGVQHEERADSGFHGREAGVLKVGVGRCGDIRVQRASSSVSVQSPPAGGVSI
jgi:hypothetical protein